MLEIMKFSKYSNFFAFILIINFFTFHVLATDEKHESRSYDKPLSDAKHDENEESGKLHDTRFDKEAFIGKEQLAEFEKLSDEEAKKKFTELIANVDKNKDGILDKNELLDQLNAVEKLKLDEEWIEKWNNLHPENNSITWEYIKEVSYGNHSKDQDPATKKTLEGLIVKDERRFKAADANKDGILAREEARDFFHPEANKNLHHLILKETLEELDKNNDGKISEEEYISDVYVKDASEENKTEPDWVKTERTEFRTNMDKNKDGFLSGDEILAWILPKTEDHVQEESEHLVKLVDTNKDGKISKEEMLNNQNKFIDTKSSVPDLPDANKKDEDHDDDDDDDDDVPKSGKKDEL